MKVLIAEDDERIREGLRDVLRSEGYEVVAAADGREALDRFRSDAPDFVLLDIMMPGLSGYDVCREIRRRGSTPVVFLSAKSQEVDKVVGLELGADDFIVKPFGVREVVARIRAVTRRCYAAASERGRGGATRPPPSFRMGDLVVRPAELRAMRSGTAIDLSLRDVKILKLFHDHPGRPLERNDILDHAWGADYMPNSRVLDQHIAGLRRRIEKDPKQPRIIRTVHGVGYRFDG